jgi:predicted TIM-barrel fold metal-dependent hydrolase
MPPHIKSDREKYIHSDSVFSEIFSDPKARMATADELISAMDNDGVDISVVLNYGWSSVSLITDINDYILESITRFPKRLIGFCTAPFDDTDAALREIERCVTAGAKGVGEIRPDISSGRDKIQLLKPVCDYLVEHGLIMSTHSSELESHSYPGKGSATPDLLISLLKLNPNLKLVCAHWGGGLHLQTNNPEIKSMLKNTYFDSAASPFLYQPEIYKSMCDAFGADKLLFGTDYPLLKAKRYFSEIKNINLPTQIEQGILGENARRLLGMGKEN